MVGGLRGAVARFFAGDGFFLAAGLAFFFSICMIPLTLLGVSIVGFVLTSEQAAREVVGQLTRNFPVYRGEITRVLLRIVQTRRASGVLGTLILILFSMPLFGAARLVMHRMLGIRRSRGFVRSLFVDAGMVLVLALLLFTALAATWVLQAVQEWLLLVPESRPWVDVSAVATSLVLSTIMFYLGFRYVPHRRTRLGPALAGGVLSAVLWEVAKQLFRLYIRQVGLYDQIYGPLGVLIAFVMFVYYSAVVFVFGAAYVAALDARR
jgi:membrane protein